MPLDRLRRAGIPIGLGSDVAAGPELNLWQVMRSAVECQKMRHFYEPEVPGLRPEEAFYLATAGGAEALGKSHQIGTLDAGKEADLLVLNLRPLLPYPPANQSNIIPRDLTPADLAALLVYRGNAQAVVETLVRGKSVYSAPQPFLFTR